MVKVAGTVFVGVACFLAVLGCGGGSDDEPASGGTSGNGGSAGAGMSGNPGGSGASGGSGTGGGTGATGGAEATGGSAGAEANGGSGGSEANPPEVGASITLAPPSPPRQGFQCNTMGVVKTIGMPAPTESDPGERVTAGDSGVQASCRVASAESYEIEADIETRATGNLWKLNLSGTIDAATKQGTATVSVFTPESLGLTSDPEMPCTLDASSPPLEVNPGVLYATFECDALMAAPSTLCGAKGVILIEHCEE